MAAPVGWRIKGVNKTTQLIADDAAARSGVCVGEWLERAINNNVRALPPEKDSPLVSTKLLNSARNPVVGTGIGEPDTTKTADLAAHQIRMPYTSDEAGQPALPLLSGNSKEPPLRVPNISPTLIAAMPRRTPSNMPRIAGGIFILALLVGSYWLVDQNTKNKIAAETNAVADRLAIASGSTDNNDGTQGRGQQTAAPVKTIAPTPLQELTAAANRGDARAQHDLGLKLVQGNGAARDQKRGARWLEKSANAGLPEAQYHIGLLYQKGFGVPSNAQTAFRWHQKAAQQSHVRAQYNLGTLFAEGKGTKKDYAEAARWFSRASKEGLAEAHYSLGMIHENGLGVERDQRKAASYYRSALAAGSSQAADKLTLLEPALKELSASVEATLPETNVTPSGTGVQPTLTKQRTLSVAGIKNLQLFLKKLDLEPGPPDGVLGSKTTEAIRLYQKFAGLPVDGKPSPELLLDLRQVVDAMSAERLTNSVR
ncbi:SEL1-like repeat protein [Alphaproteobacteria bacterium]|nr:SEL1-like repeat protein [Alphaproteobacteria bacterium]